MGAHCGSCIERRYARRDIDRDDLPLVRAPKKLPVMLS
jgi:hypothetical protein